MSEWYYVANGIQQGPALEATLQTQFASGTLPRTTLVWKEGMGPWSAASDIAVFAAPTVVKPPAYNPAPTVPPPQPPPRQERQTELPPAAPSTATLEQKNIFKGRQSFEIVDGHTLRFQIGGSKKGEQREVPLDRIDPHFTRISHWPVILLCIAAPVCFLTFIIVTATVVSCFTGSRNLDLGSLLGINALFLGIAGSLVGLVLRQRRDSAVFQVIDEAPLDLWFENPTKSAFEQFVACLSPTSVS